MLIAILTSGLQGYGIVVLYGGQDGRHELEKDDQILIHPHPLRGWRLVVGRCFRAFAAIRVGLGELDDPLHHVGMSARVDAAHGRLEVGLVPMVTVLWACSRLMSSKIREGQGVLCSSYPASRRRGVW